MLLFTPKIVNQVVYFSQTEAKRNQWMPQQDYTADDLSTRCFDRKYMQLFLSMCKSSHCQGEKLSCVADRVFLFIQKLFVNKWLCTIQNLLYCNYLEVLQASILENSDYLLRGRTMK